MSRPHQSIVFMPVTSNDGGFDGNGFQRQPHIDQRTTNPTLPCKGQYSHSPELIHINRFRNQPDSQASSALLQLPTELQVRILRYVLVHGDPIETWKNYCEELERQGKPPAKEKRKWLSLSSQVLRCCQLFYQNGSVILYQENTITIDAFHYSGLYANPACIITTLDECTRFSGKPCDNSLDSLPGGDRLSQFVKGRSQSHLKYNLKQLSSVTARMLERFQNIYIKIEVDHPGASGMDHNMYIYTLVYILRRYVAVKDVIVSMNLAFIDLDKRVMQFKCFELWRCKSIEFRDRHTKSTVADQTTQMTQQVVTGTTPVMNLERIVSLYNEVATQRERFLENGLPGYFERFQSWKLAIKAMIKQDEQAFKSHVVNLLGEILVQMDSDLNDVRTDTLLEANPGDSDEEYHDALYELHLLESKMDSRRKELQLILGKTRQD